MSTVYYCSENDVTSRLSYLGLLNCLDVPGDGVLSADDKAEMLTPAIAYASNIVDTYVAQQMPVATARGAQNEWLRDRAVDVAVARVVGTRGRELPDNVKADQERALSMLSDVRMGKILIPAFPYPAPANTRHLNQAPKVANLGQVGQGRTMRGRFPNW
jgi:hypothetical protein